MRLGTSENARIASDQVCSNIDMSSVFGGSEMATTQESDFPGNMPVKNLLAIWDATDTLLQSVLQKDRMHTLGNLVRHVRDLLNAEACALFLPADDSPNYLVLETTYTEAKGANWQKGKRLPIHSVAKGGLTGHVAKSKTFTNYNSKELASNPYSVGGHHDHLLGGKGYSYLGIPLLDRHERLLGIITADNKKGLDGSVDRLGCFDATDDAIGRLLANKLASVLESLRRFDVIRAIMEDPTHHQHVNAVLQSIIRRIVALLHCDRGDFALKDPTTDKLIVAAVEGKFTAKTLEIGQQVPDPSFIYAAWRSPEGFLLTGNVAEMGHNYYESLPDIRSEIAVRFEFKGEQIGVLNVESSELNAFDQEDKDVLTLLGSFIAVAVRVVAEQAQLLELTQRVLDYSAGLEDILNEILDAVRHMFRVDSGIIYIADYEKRMLRCVAVMGCAQNDDIKDFSYTFDEDAAATSVLINRRAFYYPDPNDPQINPRGRRAFDIHHPLVGVPLLFGSKVVGVLVVWNRSAPVAGPDLQQRLKPVATLAASRIAIWESEQLRRNAESQLASSEELYRSLVENLPHCILRKDADLKFTYANQPSRQWMAAELDEIIGKTDYNFWPFEQAKKFQADDRQVMMTDVPIIDAIESNDSKELGRTITVRFSKIPIHAANGEIAGVQTIFTDVSAEMEAAQRRRVLEERWRRLVEICPDTILVLRNGCIVFANQAGQTLLAAKRDEFGGQRLDHFLSITGKSIQQQIEALLEEEPGSLPLELNVIRRSDEESIVVELSARRLSKSASTEVLLFMHDIRRRKRMQDSLIEAQKKLKILSARRHVFISYCRENAAEVARLRDDLIAAGAVVWWDRQIDGGQDWKLEILKAMKSASAFVLCLSQELLERTASGVFPEILYAIDAYRNCAPGSVFLIPVRLSECETPLLEIDGNRLLDRIQHIDLFPPGRRKEGVDRLLEAIRTASQ